MIARKRPEPGIALYLICLLLVGGLWVAGSGVFTTARVFTSGDWAAATTPTSPVYHPLWRPLLLLELGSNLLFLFAVPTLLYLFVTRSKFFPIGVIVFFTINVAVKAVEAYMFPEMASTGRFAAGAGQSDLIAAIVELVLIGAYLIFSSHVAAVFALTKPRHPLFRFREA